MHAVTIQRLASIVYGVLFVASIGTNIVQTRTIADLRERLTTVKAAGQLSIGAYVDAISATDPTSGRHISLKVAGRLKPTVVYIFSPRCSWCARNLSNIQYLANHVSAAYDVVGLSVVDDGLNSYLHVTPLGFPAYAGLSTAQRAALKLGGTPETIVIGADGHIVKNWMGAYGGDVQKEVEQFFKIALPGLKATGVTPLVGN